MLPNDPNSAGTRPLPVILICGATGSGKTTLLHYFLSQYKGGPLAFLQFETSDFFFDLGVIRGQSLVLGRPDDAVAAIRVDETDWAKKFRMLIAQWIASATFEAVFIEVGSHAGLREIWETLEPAQEFCRIQDIVFVADALALWIEASDSMQGHPTRDASGQDRQAYIRYCAGAATQLILSKVDLLNSEQMRECRAYLERLTPKKHWIEAIFGELPLETIFSVTQTKPLLPKPLVSSWPEMEKPFVFRARRPFHPQRFHNAFFGDYEGLKRMKGFVWLATRMDWVGGLSQCGASYSMGEAGRWWASYAQDEWPQEGAARERILSNWKEPYGDRRQEILFLAPERTHATVCAALEAALLTDAEMELGPAGWKQFPDPFTQWENELINEQNGG
jgi:G3E family GTPase